MVGIGKKCRLYYTIGLALEYVCLQYKTEQILASENFLVTPIIGRIDKHVSNVIIMKLSAE